MPGAQITERVDDAPLQGHGGGEVRAGQHVLSRRRRGRRLDRGRKTLRARGRGTGTAGSRARPWTLRARVDEPPGIRRATCNARGPEPRSRSSGKAATFGGRMMPSRSPTRCCKQFAANFAAALRSAQAAVGEPALPRRRRRANRSAARADGSRTQPRQSPQCTAPATPDATAALNGLRALLRGHREARLAAQRLFGRERA